MLLAWFEIRLPRVGNLDLALKLWLKIEYIVGMVWWIPGV